MDIKPYSGRFGAEVSGLQMSNLTGDEFAVIEELLSEYEVLFFRDQALSPSDHAAFAAHFGPPQFHEAYPHEDGFPQLTILENDEANP